MRKTKSYKAKSRTNKCLRINLPNKLQPTITPTK